MTLIPRYSDAVILLVRFIEQSNFVRYTGISRTHQVIHEASTMNNYLTTAVLSIFLLSGCSSNSSNPDISEISPIDGSSDQPLDPSDVELESPSVPSQETPISEDDQVETSNPSIEPLGAIDLFTLATGSDRGFRIGSDNAVSATGDIDNDGFADILVDRGRFGSFLIRGGSERIRGILNPDDGINLPPGTVNLNRNRQTQQIGDFNGDGVSDIVGAFGGTANMAEGAGGAFVIFGNPQGVDPFISISELREGGLMEGAGFLVDGFIPNQSAGAFRGSAGDLNADGYDDLITASRLTGQIRGNGITIIYGQATFPPVVQLSQIETNDGFLSIAGEFDQSVRGPNILENVFGPGDLNGDGVDDLVIITRFTILGGEQDSIITVLYGKPGVKLSLADFNNPIAEGDGFRYRTINRNSTSGINNTRSAGDINGDGIVDLFVPINGSPQIILGSATPVSGDVVIENLPNDRIRLFGEGGIDGGSLGDINGDGRDDFLVGFDSRTLLGYVLYDLFETSDTLDVDNLLSQSGFEVSWSPDDPADGGTNRFISIQALGDIDGDGFNDVALSTTQLDSISVLYGGP